MSTATEIAYLKEEVAETLGRIGALEVEVAAILDTSERNAADAFLAANPIDSVLCDPEYMARWREEWLANERGTLAGIKFDIAECEVLIVYFKERIESLETATAGDARTTAWGNTIQCQSASTQADVRDEDSDEDSDEDNYEDNYEKWAAKGANEKWLFRKTERQQHMRGLRYAGGR